jgi:hypothetical protein
MPDTVWTCRVGATWYHQPTPQSGWLAVAGLRFESELA